MFLKNLFNSKFSVAFLKQCQFLSIHNFILTQFLVPYRERVLLHHVFMTTDIVWIEHLCNKTDCNRCECLCHKALRRKQMTERQTLTRTYSRISVQHYAEYSCCITGQLLYDFMVKDAVALSLLLWICDQTLRTLDLRNWAGNAVLCLHSDQPLPTCQVIT